MTPQTSPSAQAWLSRTVSDFSQTQQFVASMLDRSAHRIRQGELDTNIVWQELGGREELSLLQRLTAERATTPEGAREVLQAPARSLQRSLDRLRRQAAATGEMARQQTLEAQLLEESSLVRRADGSVAAVGFATPVRTRQHSRARVVTQPALQWDGLYAAMVGDALGTTRARAVFLPVLLPYAMGQVLDVASAWRLSYELYVWAMNNPAGHPSVADSYAILDRALARAGLRVEGDSMDMIEAAAGAGRGDFLLRDADVDALRDDHVLIGALVLGPEWSEVTNIAAAFPLNAAMRHGPQFLEPFPAEMAAFSQASTRTRMERTRPLLAHALKDDTLTFVAAPAPLGLVLATWEMSRRWMRVVDESRRVLFAGQIHSRGTPPRPPRVHVRPGRPLVAGASVHLVWQDVRTGKAQAEMDWAVQMEFEAEESVLLNALTAAGVSFDRSEIRFSLACALKGAGRPAGSLPVSAEAS